GLIYNHTTTTTPAKRRSCLSNVRSCSLRALLAETDDESAVYDPSAKHFLNAPENLVVESLQGLCTLNPQIALDVADKVVYVAKQDRSKVALICGGGAGHEPAHAGFVGDGMLTAAACGTVFASPNTSQVRRAIDLVENEQGNYTGDILNFGLAREQYAAEHPEKSDKVKTQGKIVGRRGLAGTCLVYKVAGALAKRGGSLAAVHGAAAYVAAHVGTVGVGLEHCHVPGTAAGASHLGAAEIEIGMGIHNEPGNRRLAPVPPLAALVPQLLDLLTGTADPERAFVPFKGGDRVVLLLELPGVVRETRAALEKQGFVIERVLAGTFMVRL
ncbi:Dak kinase, partial [Fomitopsis serialis]|uniref:Dak kinase n=1 Tax=Fomitopsis serialis TaxID=139415 RepID=UPI002007F715